MSQYLYKKNIITKERIINYNEIKIIIDLIKCSICLEIIYKPYECEICGSLFCKNCINEWLKLNIRCPLKCEKFKLIEACSTTKKLLNLIKLKCVNYPECDLISNYWDIIKHEENCKCNKFKCPYYPCQFLGNFQELKNHIINLCNYVNVECGICKCSIQKQNFDSHLEEHYQK